MSANQVNNSRLFTRSGAVVAFAALTACGGFERSGQPLDDLTAQAIFERGEREIERGKPDDAAFTFGEIERLYPYSEFAERALIMQAFAYHRDQDYPNSRASAQRYLDFYPTQQDAPYAAYLLALSYYDQIDDIGRDQGLTFQALQALRDGKVDAVVYDSAILRHTINQEFRDELAVLPIRFETQNYGIGLPTGSELRESLNQSLLRITGEPDWHNTLYRYLGE